MPVLETKSLFEAISNRKQIVSELLEDILPGMPPEAIYYELTQQGLLTRGKVTLHFDIWDTVECTLKRLQEEWGGPDVPVFLLPITNKATKNGVAYRKGICLFVSSQMTESELQALFAHEYHHMCRWPFIEEPPTLKDSIVMEGVAEHAVESLYGTHMLSPWTKRYSLEEIQEFWPTYFAPMLQVRGLENHHSFLYGDASLGLPPWIGYSTGYRIVEAFQQRCGPFGQQELLQVSADQIIIGAGFAIEPD